MNLAETALSIAQPGLALPLRCLSAARAGGSAALAWVVKSPIHILVVLLATAIGGNAWQWHTAQQRERASATQLLAWHDRFDKIQAAYLIDAHSLDLVLPALQRQDAAIRHLGDQAAAIGAAELRAATVGTSGIARARAISATGRAEALTWGKGDPACHTGPAGQAAAKRGAF